MSTTARFLRRNPSETEPFGHIRPLIEEVEGATAEVHHVENEAAEVHDHEMTDGFYDVINSEGTIVLADEVIELHQG